MKKDTNPHLIPKIIHYCWFGGNPLPELAQRCISSWEKYCPDYEIRRWDESNFPISNWTYAKEAYDKKKWAFVSDVARLWALVNVGGIYMDTDVEVIRSLDELLDYDAVSGFESETQIPTGLIACRKEHPFFIELLREYDELHFVKLDGSLDLTTNVSRITNACLQYGLHPDNTLQTVNGFTLLPRDYLCPKDFTTGKVNITNRTFTIHHFNGSWLNEEQRYDIILRREFIGIIPEQLVPYLIQFLIEIRFRGVGVAIKKTILWFKSCIFK